MARNGKVLRLIAGLAVLCATTLACADRPAAPGRVSSAAAGGAPLVSPDGGIAGAEGFDLDAPLQVAVGGSTNGHAEVQGTPVQNVRDEKFSFTAVADGTAPAAKGQVEVHFDRFTGEEIVVHADVTCVSVVGNQAWVGTRVTRFVLDGQETPGDRRMIFRVQDNGDDAGSADLASLVFFGAPGLDLTHCNTRQAFPLLRATTTGNIQVKPE